MLAICPSVEPCRMLSEASRERMGAGGGLVWSGAHCMYGFSHEHRFRGIFWYAELCCSSCILYTHR